MTQDEVFMAEALREAELAYAEDEVPIGAVAVLDGQIIARAHNQKEQNKNALCHAEINLLKICAEVLDRWRLTDVTVYVTIEPCIMCMGALLHARIPRLVFGARDQKFGAAKSLYELATDERLNHTFRVEEGILQERCSGLMQDFFRQKR